MHSFAHAHFLITTWLTVQSLHALFLIPLPLIQTKRRMAKTKKKWAAHATIITMREQVTFQRNFHATETNRTKKPEHWFFGCVWFCRFGHWIKVSSTVRAIYVRLSMLCVRIFVWISIWLVNVWNGIKEFDTILLLFIITKWMAARLIIV